MIVNKSKVKFSIAEIAMLILSLVFFCGIRNWFPTCAVTSEQTMPCHWAGEMLCAISGIFVLVSVILIFVPDIKIKAGMDISLAFFYLLTMFIPGNIIKICGSDEMACRAQTLPWTMGICIACILFIVIDIFFCYSAYSKEKHKRKD